MIKLKAVGAFFKLSCQYFSLSQSKDIGQTPLWRWRHLEVVWFCLQEQKLCNCYLPSIFRNWFQKHYQLAQFSN